ncbi:hypothetical protein ABIA31_007946 [Catenulispora sp. MAP5-51]|uniref:hypothetical protein n=1 Tax=Catenulispora sp. MAP5-51 TaxID=3156298 RepID=UPI0035141ECB
MQVSRSGFYHWRVRPASATAQRRQELAVLIYEAFHIAGDGAYGYRRVHAHLARQVEGHVRDLAVTTLSGTPPQPVIPLKVVAPARSLQASR